LDDGNRGSNTQGRERSLKFVMAHPDDPTRHLVLEMLLDEDAVDAEHDIVGGRESDPRAGAFQEAATTPERTSDAR
jgi:hypothetical protein